MYIVQVFRENNKTTLEPAVLWLKRSLCAAGDPQPDLTHLALAGSLQQLKADLEQVIPVLLVL